MCWRRGCATFQRPPRALPATTRTRREGGDSLRPLREGSGPAAASSRPARRPWRRRRPMRGPGPARRADRPPGRPANAARRRRSDSARRRAGAGARAAAGGSRAPESEATSSSSEAPFDRAAGLVRTWLQHVDRQACAHWAVAASGAGRIAEQGGRAAPEARARLSWRSPWRRPPRVAVASRAATARLRSRT